jgi:uncharacterized protein YggE
MKPVLASLALLICSGLASANITVTGTGKVVYVPDIGYISVGVSSDGKTAEEAWQKNSAIVQKLFDALKAMGLEPKDYKTSGLNLTPRYVHHKDREPELVGYTASYDLTVTVRKLNELGKVLDTLVENGANRRMNISLGCADPEKLLDQARIKAVADARKKAELYLTGAGASLGQVLSISEGQNFAWRSLPYEHAVQAGKAPLPIAAGEQEMAVNVTVTYAINQKPWSRLEDNQMGPFKATLKADAGCQGSP